MGQSLQYTQINNSPVTPRMVTGSVSIWERDDGTRVDNQHSKRVHIEQKIHNSSNSFIINSVQTINHIIGRNVD